jgi:hypothetical protein
MRAAVHPTELYKQGQIPSLRHSFALATSRAKARVSPLHPSRRSRGPSRSSSSSSFSSSSSSSSSSCKLEKRERAEEEINLSDLAQHCTFAATGSSLSNLWVH